VSKKLFLFIIQPVFLFGSLCSATQRCQNFETQGRLVFNLNHYELTTLTDDGSQAKIKLIDSNKRFIRVLKVLKNTFVKISLNLQNNDYTLTKIFKAEINQLELSIPPEFAMLKVSARMPASHFNYLKLLTSNNKFRIECLKK
jgi:hypothetical protein